MLYDAYETTLTRNYQIEKIRANLIKAYISDDLSFTAADSEGKQLDGLKLLIGNAEEIPPVVHPLSFSDRPENRELSQTVVIDVRAMVRPQRGTRSYQVVNQHEYRFLLLRGQLSALWNHRQQEQLGNAHTLPASAYGRWFSQGLTHRLGLTAEDQVTATLLSTCFYLNSFYPEEQINNALLTDRRLLQLGRLTYTSPDQIAHLKESFATLVTLEDLIDSLKEQIDNPRIELLNYGLLVGILTYGWYGANGKEIMAVAMEYPPTWIAVVMIALTSRVVKNSPISRLLTPFTRKGVDQDFLKAMARQLTSGEPVYG